MRLLCFDTSLDKTYIALKSADKFLQREIKSDNTNYHSAYLIPEIKKMTEESGISLNTLEALAVNCGPGSFTGIRAALSVAKVMALELNLPVITLNSCEILKAASGCTDAVVALDARRLMYYFYDGGQIELVLKENMESKMKNKTVICDSGVARDFSEKIDARFVNYEVQNYPLAKVMCSLAISKVHESDNFKEEFSHEKLRAKYIQTPPVFTKGN